MQSGGNGIIFLEELPFVCGGDFFGDGGAGGDIIVVGSWNNQTPNSIVCLMRQHPASLHTKESVLPTPRHKSPRKLGNAAYLPSII
eukprot:scaffold11406_cov136-Skeletonema_marinoi.AAC.4